MPHPRWDRIWTDVKLATMTGPSLDMIEDGAIASAGGRIAWVGREADLPAGGRQTAGEIIRCGGAWLTPGLIDCHTHIVFGGDRTRGSRRRLRGE